MVATLPSLLLLLHLLVFVGIGTFFRKRIRILAGDRPADDAMLTWAAAALGGYVVFWVDLLDQRAGIVASSLLCVIGLAEGSKLVLTWAREGWPFRVSGPMALAIGVALVYLGIFFLVPLDYDAQHSAAFRFLPDIPLDNLLPGIFAERLWNGIDPRGFPNTWLSSDRPPLQAGILLLLRPVSVAVGQPQVTSDFVVGLIAQLGWIPSLWAMLSLPGETRRSRAVVLAFCATTGFVFFNTVYVWPKMLAGAFALGSILQFLRARLESRPLTRSEWTLSALLAALALLSHTGVVFTFIGLTLVLPLFRKQLDARGFALACLTGLVLLLPWTAYQKFYEPPANRLSKWHLAGAIDIDDRTVGEAVADAYGSRTAGQVADLKLGNLGALFARHAEVDDLRDLRVLFYLYFFPSLGLLNLGWLVMAFRPRTVPDQARLMTAVVGSAIVVWVILIIGPAMTFAPHGSFATSLLACIALGSAIATLERRFVLPLLAVHLLVFAVVWLSPLTGEGHWVGLRGLSPDAAAVLAIGAFVSWRALRGQGADEEPAETA